MRRKGQAQLRGKVVVITGGSRGLGLALAEEFGRLGAKLVLAARDAEELNRATDSLARRIRIAADAILTVTADLREPEQAIALIERATERFGQVDILVNNAGIIAVGPVENQTSESFQEVMAANFFSSVHCSLAAVPQMLARRGGSIVNIASVGGKIAIPHLLPYTASKFAEVGFSQGLHAELRSKGIHVLTVCPGLMRTGSHLNALFCGDAAREFRWFSLLASLPGISVSARHAAKRIVRAVSRRESEIAISPQAAWVARLAPTMPGLTARAMGAANNILPSPNQVGGTIRRGSQARERELRPATMLGTRAARRYNQFS
jgi:short-subunit dehydrogenase